MSLTRIKATNFKPLKNTVFVEDMDSGVRKTHKGIILPDDNMSQTGIRPRWAKVYTTGPDVIDLVPGEWILIRHGRWTLGIDLEFEDRTVRIWRVEYPDAVELVSSHDPRNTHKITL